MEFSAVDSGIVLTETVPALLVHRTVIVSVERAQVYSKGVEKVFPRDEQQALSLRTAKRLELEYGAALEAPGLVFLDGSLIPPSFLADGAWKPVWKRLLSSQKKVMAVSKDSLAYPKDIGIGKASESKRHGNVETFFYKRLPWEPPFRVDLLNVEKEFAVSLLEKNLAGKVSSKFLPTEAADFHARIRESELSLLALKAGVADKRRKFKLL